jgi:ribonuclease HI
VRKVTTREPPELVVVRNVVATLRLEQPIPSEAGNRFVAYTDGSCLRNPDGPSGFGAVVRSEGNGQVWKLAGHLTSSTNNRAEWAALASALLFVPSGSHLVAFSDSQYVLQVALGQWKRKANLDLWQAWDELRRAHPVELELRWVLGHAADPGNEQADALATLAAFNFDRPAWTLARTTSDSAQAVQRLQPLAHGDWENRFLRDVAKRLQRGLQVSPKQQAILDRISARALQGQNTNPKRPTSKAEGQES